MIRLLISFSGSSAAHWRFSIPSAYYDNKVFFWWFILFELVTSLHGQQTNPFIAALGFLTFTFLENDRTRWATLFPLLAFCIKGYGLIYAGIFLFYPRKGQFIGYSVLWTIVLALSPLPVTGINHFVQAYKDWYMILLEDHQVNYVLSVMGLLKFSPDDVTKVQLVGIAPFMLTWLFCFFKVWT